ncbi:MAG: SUMF1/EgtB/PvdO family nonheme iron enzyme [Candidatus Eisenbacteria bacterium]|nr:SUMF1/EgtB/PvdO family nonheme iron enzyme [Candidatus Eisenbacteria bacterium]
MTDRLLLELANTKRFVVIDRTKRDEILKEQGFTLTGACDQTTCLVEIGKLLDAEKMAGGSVGKFGATWMVNIRLVDVTTGKVEKTSLKDFKGDVDVLVGLMKEVAQEIAGVDSDGTMSRPGQAIPKASREKEGEIATNKPIAPPEQGGDGVPQGMAHIPAGSFMMGSGNGNSDEKPVHKVDVDAFYMDKYEVTAEQYDRFIGATGQREPEDWGGQLRYPNRPVVFVSWDDANAFAKWAGKRLPTEAEWEYAARGGNTGADGKAKYEYPWGKVIDTGRAHFDPDGSRRWRGEDAKRYLRDVGSYPPNGYGLFDMAGNVSEWVTDLYGKAYDVPIPRSSNLQGSVTRGPPGVPWRLLGR